MTTNRSGAPEGGYLTVLRIVALIALAVGAAGSVCLMAYAGRRNNSRILLLLFTIWVLSPWVAAGLAHMVSKRWTAAMRATLYAAMLLLTLGSLAIYADVAFGHPNVKTGFIFLVVPFASWLLLGIIVATATILSGRRSRRETQG
jgi:hypothetical protein